MTRCPSEFLYHDDPSPGDVIATGHAGDGVDGYVIYFYDLWMQEEYLALLP